MPLAGTQEYFFRTRAGAEIDLLLLLPDRRLWAIEVKRTSAPRATKGFRIAAADLKPDARFIVYAGEEEFPVSRSTIATPLAALMRRLALMGNGDQRPD